MRSMLLLDMAWTINIVVATFDFLGVSWVGHILLSRPYPSGVAVASATEDCHGASATEDCHGQEDGVKNGVGNHSTTPLYEKCGDVAEADQHMEAGLAFFARGLLAEAEGYFQLARTMYYQSPGGACHHSRIARACTKLGQSHLLMKKFDSSLEMLKEGLRMYRCSDENVGLEMSRCLISLAIRLRSHGQYGDALSSLEEAHAILKQTNGDVETGDLALVLCEKGDCHHDLGEDVLAMQSRIQALNVCREVHGNDSESVVALLTSIGHSFQKQGDLSSARQEFEEALEISKRLHGNEHETVPSLLTSIAIILSLQERHDEALYLFKKALKISRRILGRDHADVTCILYHMAETFEKQGMYDDAISCLSQILDINNRRHGSDCLQNARLQCAMIDLRHGYGDEAGAKKSAKECIRIYKKAGVCDAADAWLHKAKCYVQRSNLSTSFKICHRAEKPFKLSKTMSF
jgi:tetratricopeptide (TPR) repeat protein